MKDFKETLQKLGEKLPEKLRGDKKLALIAVLCVLGVVCLALSALPGKAEKNTEESGADSVPQVDQADVSAYITQLEGKLAQLISEMDGAGKTRVMLTLENGTEEVFAGNEEQKSSGGQEGAGVSGASGSASFEYIKLRAKDGSEQGLLLTVVQPRVRGVAVVCEGAGSALVQTAILQTVTAVLDVSSARVSISKMQT
jgi:stage III sporulation protein AG